MLQEHQVLQLHIKLEQLVQEQAIKLAQEVTIKLELQEQEFHIKLDQVQSVDIHHQDQATNMEQVFQQVQEPL